MSAEKSEAYLVGLLSELIKLPTETGWLEFKENNSNLQDIGEYLSALSNTAALSDKSNAYVVWGVNDDTHTVVGTTFRPSIEKKGNENLDNWLLRLLNPRLYFGFYEFLFEGKPVVLLEIPRATVKPVQFDGLEFVRVGSYRKKLKDHPEIERELWRVFNTTRFEELRAIERVDADKVLGTLDYPAYFELLEQPLPADRDKILARLGEDQMIFRNLAGGWDITNLGAILFAKNLNSCKELKRKKVRVILYEGHGRLNALRESEIDRGYAAGFETTIAIVNAWLPRSEVMGKALRKDLPRYPELAVRELVANALIHQDFTVTGAGPMIEIFSDRMEITNPGLPLVTTERFLDTPPRSRNEMLASFMRRIGICEERGSGVDKVVSETERFQLPAPLFETLDQSTRVVLSSHKPLNDMDRADRVRACYLHACLRHVEHSALTNSSLRERFGVAEHNSSIISRIIREGVQDGRIKPHDPDQGKKYAKYQPYWA